MNYDDPTRCGAPDDDEDYTIQPYEITRHSNDYKLGTVEDLGWYWDDYNGDINGPYTSSIAAETAAQKYEDEQRDF